MYKIIVQKIKRIDNCPEHSEVKMHMDQLVQESLN